MDVWKHNFYSSFYYFNQVFDFSFWIFWKWNETNVSCCCYLKQNQVWWLWSPAPLAGNHFKSWSIKVVLLRLALLGTGLYAARLIPHRLHVDPPLTAYHSWVLGHLAKLINKDWVALDSSRGFESDSLKLFMRLTALFTDCLILLPAILYYSHVVASKNRGKYLVLILGASLTRLVCVDNRSCCIDMSSYCHYRPWTFPVNHIEIHLIWNRYNAAMLGFALLAFSCFLESRFALGSLFFVCSLAFKQMALFYALPVFFHLLVRLGIVDSN